MKMMDGRAVLTNEFFGNSISIKMSSVVAAKKRKCHLTTAGKEKGTGYFWECFHEGKEYGIESRFNLPSIILHYISRSKIPLIFNLDLCLLYEAKKHVLLYQNQCLFFPYRDESPSSPRQRRVCLEHKNREKSIQLLSKQDPRPDRITIGYNLAGPGLYCSSSPVCPAMTNGMSFWEHKGQIMPCANHVYFYRTTGPAACGDVCSVLQMARLPPFWKDCQVFVLGATKRWLRKLDSIISTSMHKIYLIFLQVLWISLRTCSI